MHMRSENPPLCGRDHLSYRSYYFPVRVSYTNVYVAQHVLHIFVRTLIFIVFCLNFLKNVIDGDLCEQYNSIDPSKQRNIAEELDRTPNEVAKKLEDIRTRYAF